ncbi:putative cytochrome P450 oxidoreductase OrdA-like protein [Hypoxylon cercidicola]|nr:putative cytochrome P450 oxidoreductase OrdA-like protein [Hypoxylon cercidicola]
MATLLSTLQLSCFALVAFVAVIVLRASFRQPKGNVPPGPKPLPIIGNFFDLPSAGQAEFQHWLKHKDAYGPVSSISVMGTTLIIFHDKDVAHAYNEKYRKHRKMVHQEIGTKGLSAGFHPIQEKESLHFILETFQQPDAILHHLKTLAAAIVLNVTYGYNIDRSQPDPLVELIDHAMENLSKAFVPLYWAVGHLPNWFPGMSYRKTAQKWKAINEAAAQLPYDFVKRQMARRAHSASYVSNLLESSMAKSASGEVSLAAEDEEAIKWTAVSLYAAGSDSTVAIIHSVLCALVIFPEVVKRAQEEIDRVVGTNRLPSLTSTASSRKRGDGIPYLIPKGSYLLPSLWWFLNDPNEYPEPRIFKPERYMEPLNNPDPSELAFGYGRRSCAGRFFADASVYIAVVQLLAAFDVRKAKYSQGRGIPVTLEAIPGMVNRPAPFEFKVEPRSQRQIDLLHRILSEQKPEVSHASLLRLSEV